MNGFVISTTHFCLRHAWLVIVVIGCVGLGGCKPEPPSANADQSLPSDRSANSDSSSVSAGPGGEAILKQLLTRYRSAKSYHDEGVLYLNYRLNDRNIQEPQEWATTWDSSGRLAAQLFNSRVTADGNLLSCYVYDIDTGNLDNQQLWIPYDRQLPLNQLFRDSIAKHFLGGFAELPLDETDSASIPKLIPPPISLLTDQVRCGWLQSPSAVQRLDDAEIDQRPCFVIRCQYDSTTADVWIDQQTFVLVQMSLPLKLLAGEVISSPQITDVSLVARFQNAVMDAPLDSETFTAKQISDATPVRRFVSLPETLPSEMIGQPAPDFQLFTPSGQARERSFFDGKVTAVLWLGGPGSYDAIDELATLAGQLAPERFNFAAVYSDADLKQPGSGSLTVAPALAERLKDSFPAYYDQELRASTALKIKAIPSIVVLDRDSRIQFAVALADKSWVPDVSAALQRVNDGEDLAAEMQQEYQRYLESYHQQLATVSAAKLISKPETEATQVAASLNRPMRMNPTLAWANTEFKRPGNVYIQESEPGAPPRYMIFDGWRTVVEIDSSGKTIRSTELTLPAGEAVNALRTGRRGPKGSLQAVFSVLGDQVFLFDQTWGSLQRYPGDAFTHSGIRDCQLMDLDGDGVSELLVAFDDQNGIHRVDPETGRGKKISETVATSLAQLESEFAVATAGNIVRFPSASSATAPTELKFRRIIAAGNNSMCGVGHQSNGAWSAVGFDASLKRNWTLSIGSQFFETAIEPMVVTEIASESAGADRDTVWAIADIDDIIHLVSGSGKWLGDFQSQSPLSGLALGSHGDQTVLVVSNAEGIECWQLNLRPSPIRPISSRK